MEKFIVVVFENENKAYEGLKVVKRLDADASIAVHQAVVIRKQADGSVTVPQGALEDFPVRTLEGTALGGLIGLLAGPVGLAFGMTAGALAGLIGDATRATLDEEFLKEVSSSLSPGDAAVVIDASEEWVTPLDTELEPISKGVFRLARIDATDEFISKRIEATEAEIDSLEKEQAQGHQERKARLQARIDTLKQRVSAQMARLEQRKNELHEESQAKIEALQAKVSKSAAETKSKLQTRLDALREADLNFQNRVQKAMGSTLRKAADRLEGKRA